MLIGNVAGESTILDRACEMQLNWNRLRSRYSTLGVSTVIPITSRNDQAVIYSAKKMSKGFKDAVVLTQNSPGVRRLL